MQITLELLNARGDEIGRMPMPAIRLTPAGESTARPNLRGDITRVGEMITDALAQEGLALDVDPIALRLTVARALVSHDGESDGGEVRIPLGVRGVDPVPGRGVDPVPFGARPGAAPARPGGASDHDEWNDMFTVDGADGPHPTASEHATAPQQATAPEHATAPDKEDSSEYPL